VKARDDFIRHQAEMIVDSPQTKDLPARRFLAYKTQVVTLNQRSRFNAHARSR
jgi:hypothetical protein